MANSNPGSLTCALMSPSSRQSLSVPSAGSCPAWVRTSCCPNDPTSNPWYQEGSSCSICYTRLNAVHVFPLQMASASVFHLCEAFMALGQGCTSLTELSFPQPFFIVSYSKFLQFSSKHTRTCHVLGLKLITATVAFPLQKTG